MATPNTQKISLVSNRGEWFAYYHCDEFRIGNGAMGEVFKGWRMDNPEQKVAIKKVFQRHAEVPQIRERARYEASLSIDHPNLIKMLGYCEFDKRKGSIYIISDLVRGNTINRFVANLDITMRVEIISRMMCSVLDALTCLHTQNPPIWHRDLKPSNIMVENGRNVRVMDLGIATTDGISFGTLEGRGFGTYPYAPPEQITGKKGQINGTSDIYSLGVTFYELLTELNPFAGGSDVDIMERQISMTLPYNNRIPKPLYKVLLKATAKQQSERYRTAAAFKEAIIKANDQQSTTFPKWILWVGLAGIALLAVLISLLS
jgi:serine/threonine-protein kinase